MNFKIEIEKYLSSQADPKQKEMRILHQNILNIAPNCKLWFLDGKDANNKVVSNPNIGYGQLQLKYKDGSSREFYQIGLSANTTGISIYIMGLDDKNFLKNKCGDNFGKAKISGYCINFKSLQDIQTDILYACIKYGFENCH